MATPSLTRRPLYSHLQVYDTPPMAVKGPNGQEPGQEIYDVPPSVEKNLHQTVSAAGKLPASLFKKDKQIFTGRKNDVLDQSPQRCGDVPGTGSFQNAKEWVA